jgi:uncharacterized protein (DUF1330 family)
MSAYLVFTKEKTIDQQELDQYSHGVAATLAGHEVKLLTYYGVQENLEGDSSHGTVILEFPSREAAKAWYNSPAYGKVREHRFKGAKFSVTLVEGGRGS